MCMTFFGFIYCKICHIKVYVSGLLTNLLSMKQTILKIKKINLRGTNIGYYYLGTDVI